MNFKEALTELNKGHYLKSATLKVGCLIKQRGRNIYLCKDFLVHENMRFSAKHIFAEDWEVVNA